jgi:hypothetical protein
MLSGEQSSTIYLNQTIIDIVKNANLIAGEQTIIKDIGFKFPLKIVISVEELTATVITTYPLKKGRKK